MRIAPNATFTTKSPKACNIAAFVCFFLVILGVLLATVVHSAISAALTSGLEQKFVLSGPDAQAFPAWSQADNPSSPLIFTDFYIHHILNPDDIVLRGAKPNLTEIGPIRYYFKRARLNVTWDANLDNDQLSFIPYNYYVPLPDDQPYQATVLCANDRTQTCSVTTTTSALTAMTFTTVNMPLTGVLHSSVVSDPLVAAVLYEILAGPTLNATDPRALFTQKTAGEIIWGWEDPILKALSPLAHNPTRYPGVQTNMSSADEARAIHSPTTMYTGVLTKHLARQYYIWDGMLELECCDYGVCGDAGSLGPRGPIKPWNTIDAETIRGAFGENFHQFIDPSETLRVSTHDFGILRSWPLVNQGSGPPDSGTDIAGTGANGGSAGATLDVQGITLLQFTFADGVLGNASVNPEEAYAFNVDGPSGLLNQSTCEWGAQVFTSQPRFYGASESLRAGVNGLGPATAQQHGTYLGVEPYTGTTMDFHWRVGINVLLQPTLLTGAPNPLFFPNAPTVFTPIMWADRYGSISASEAHEFKTSVYLARDMMVTARWGGVAMACVALLSGIVFLLLASRRRRDRQHARELSAAAFYASNAGLDGSMYAPFLPPPGYDGGGDALSPMSDVMMLQQPNGTQQPLGVAGGLNVGAVVFPPGTVGVGRSINSGGGPMNTSGRAGNVAAFAGGGFFSPTTAAANGPGGLLANADVYEEEVAFDGGDRRSFNDDGGGTAASSYGGNETSPFPLVRHTNHRGGGGGMPSNAAEMLVSSPQGTPLQQQGRQGRKSFDMDKAATAQAWSATAGHY